MSDAIDAFSAHAPDYDATRRAIVPCWDAFYGTAVELVSLRGWPVERVLDIGAGTGFMSEAVFAAHPSAQLVLLDGSEEMLAHASERLPQAEIVQGDMRDGLPAGPFDAVVSSLAIHHLEHDEQRRPVCSGRRAAAARRRVRERRAHPGADARGWRRRAARAGGQQRLRPVPARLSSTPPMGAWSSTAARRSRSAWAGSKPPAWRTANASFSSSTSRSLRAGARPERGSRRDSRRPVRLSSCPSSKRCRPRKTSWTPCRT